MRRLLPLPVAVAAVVLFAVAGLMAVLFMTQFAEGVGSLTGYEAECSALPLAKTKMPTR